ncbi:hypothetical protein ACQR1Y_11625 [Bradyrhizobium sp. HKCCYLRH3099]|uniref:hypothetical protein n=1 Tax=unclassified Bradyrhizobium TaxID=2631580 RepID=UPI003EBFEE2B
MPPDPNELLLQADALAAPASATQVDLRRAISAAYYAVFHFCLTFAADMVCGSAVRSSDRYRHVYRSIDHSTLRNLCDKLRKTSPKDIAIAPSMGFGNISDFARIAVTLQELRHRAEYDPQPVLTALEARTAVSEARQAITWFTSSNDEQQKTFLVLLLSFKQRSL